MTPPSNDLPAAADLTLSNDELERIGSICGRFEQTWRDAPADAPGPSTEPFLEAVEERLRPTLRAALERIDQTYRERRTHPQPDGGTVSLPGRTSHAGATVDMPRLKDTSPDRPGAAGSAGQPPTSPHDPTGTFGAVPQGSTVTGDHAPGRDSPNSRTSGGFPDVPGHEILDELGKGGMGVVYKAWQAGTNRPVALKMIVSGAHARPEELERFSAEARAIASLNHPNIVQIFQVGEHQGLPFFSLEYVDGGTLAGKLKGRPLPPREAATLTVTLARAMAVAHGIKIIHRDLKPANILMTRDGQLKITDFGLAKRLDDDSGMTRTGSVMGTPSYMAPEQAWGRDDQIGTCSDIYAIGAILYDLLTGRPPFQGVTTLETLDLVRHKEPLPPSRLQPKLPADLETICLKCLEKEPARRYESATALADDLQRFLDGRPILARPVSKAEHAWRWAKRNPIVAGLGSTVAALLVTVAVVSSVLTVQANKARDAEAVERGKAEKARDAEEIARKEAVRNAQTAQEQLELSVGVVRDLVLSVQDELRKRPEFLPIREHVLRIASNGIERVRSSYLTSPLVDRTDAAISTMLGGVEVLVGRVAEAGTVYRRAEELLRAELVKNPDDPVAHRNLAAVLNQRGDVAIRLGDVKGARDLYQQALALRLKWRELNPSNERITQALAESHNLLGRVAVLLGDVVAARVHYDQQRALYEKLPDALRALPDTRRDLASLDEKLGLVAWREGNLDLADKLLETSNKQRAALREEAERAGSAPLIKRDTALILYHRGDLYMLGRNNPARAWLGYQRSCRMFIELLEEFPEGYNERRDVAMLQYRAGECARRLKGVKLVLPKDFPPPGAPETYFAECLKLREQLARIDPDDVQARIDLMTALARNGWYFEARTIADRLLADFDVDARDLYQAACGLALCAANPDPDDALAARDRAITVLDGLLKVGWNDRMTLETDPDLDPIRDDPRFIAILSRLPKTP